MNEEPMASSARWLPPPTKDLLAAKRQYVEQFGSVLVTNTYLKIAVLALSLVAVALVALNLKTYQAFRDLKPLVIRIDDIGRAEALRYDSFAYQPQEAEIKYFLMDFVQRHYSRMRATVRENFARSLYYLDGRLADALIEQNKKAQTIELFLAGGTDEIEVHVNNVSIEDLRHAPYRATVEFEKVFYAPSTHLEARREKYVANVVFVVRDRVPNDMVPVNPLGLTISYFREDQAFR
jgi:type IV secretory pathway TrbF-like protein